MPSPKGWKRWKSKEGNYKKPKDSIGVDNQFAWVQTPKKTELGYDIKVRRNSYQAIFVRDTINGYRIRLGRVSTPEGIANSKQEWLRKAQPLDTRAWTNAPGSNNKGFFTNKEKARKAAVKLMKNNSKGIVNASEIR